MKRPMLSKCPVCHGKMNVTKLHCSTCNSSLEGNFETCKFCQLNVEQREFVEVFLATRGNIKEVERLLGISYPTVRNRLDNVIEALGYRVERDEDDRRKEILKALDKGEITVEEGSR